MNCTVASKWLIVLSCLLSFTSFAQKEPVFKSISGSMLSLCFVKQEGQYADTSGRFKQLGKIVAGYEGFSTPVLFTERGLVFLQRKQTKLTHRQEEELEKKGIPEDEIENRRNVVTKAVSMEWLNGNTSPEIVFLDKTDGYTTYGKMPVKVYSYRKLLYKNVYPGIDVEYTLDPLKKLGFEYSLIVHPGADIAAVKMTYGGDVKKIKANRGRLAVETDIDEIVQDQLASFNTNAEGQFSRTAAAQLVETEFKVNDNTVRFDIKGNYDRNKIFVIDPFVSSTAALTGASAGIAKDVDFDYAGNVYVSGGGDGNVYQLAKYNANGVLQWTFNDIVSNPQWSFGPYFGGWVVEKTTGNIYLGQGFDFATGFIVVRISTTGLYDNFITTGNPNFRENWKMIWNCNNGLPQIIVAGGGTNSNINLGLLAPPSVIPSAANITGIPDIAFQDMADMVIDPLTNSMYTLYASGSVPTLNNSIYKHDQPYSAATKAWNTASGYNVLQEAANRPYVVAGLNDNSANILAINPFYLFYWDGKNLKALDKATGAVVGTPIITTNTALMQGGIIADACNNVFAGDINGTIKVYNFNGSVFDDAAAPDIHIAGFATKPVYDLAYNETQKLLYASGNGFVSSIDVSTYCPNTVYTLNVSPNCLNASVTATISPIPPNGSTITYTILEGATQIATNNTGLFTSLNSTVTYKIVATVNQACSGTQTSVTFVMPGPAVNAAVTNASCGANSGVISVSGSGTSAPYSYSIDGVNFQSSGNFGSLPAGVYTITVKDGNGCTTKAPVTILNSNGPALTFTQLNANCGNSNASITASATGGTAPYQFSINGGTTYQVSNFFTALVAGDYTLVVKDAAGCTNAAVVTITSSPSPVITAIPAAATCSKNNGIINAFGAGGTAPYEYSINQNIFQPGNTFPDLTPGLYTVTVKDVNGCIQNTNVTIGNTAAPTVTATATQSACANFNGSITATGLGGLAPLQYSINNGPLQTNNVFNGLAGGVYNVQVKDISGCVGNTSVTITSVSNGPTVTATTNPSACNINNGSINAIATAGLPPYQYSLNNTVYQASGLFSGLAPARYVVFAKDAAGCVNTTAVVVTPTAGPVLTVTATGSSCLVNNGSITAAATGGAAPLLYSIDGINFVPTNVFNGLAPNTYTVTVKDANGCSRSSGILVANASGLSLDASSISTSCSSSGGSITITANGGIAPLQYSINGTNYFSSNTFTGLSAGNYTAFVKDANGCIVSKVTSVASTAGPSLNLNARSATCGTASGVIIAAVSGGVQPFTYSLDGGPFQSLNAFVNVSATSHTVIAKDAGGCTASQTVSVTDAGGAGAIPTDVTFTVRNALPCTGGVVKIKNLKGVPSGGGAKYDFALDFGAFTSSNQFTNVFPGNHVVTAINEDGCTVSKLAIIGTGVPARANAVATGSACNATSGTISITGIGANTPYHASIDNGVTWNTFFPPGANSFTYTNLAPGSYTILMADDADFTAGTPDIPGACITATLAIVPTIGGPVLSTIKSDGTCSGSDGFISATGTGVSPLSYSINGGAYQSSGDFTNLVSGDYIIGVQDANGCASSVSVNIANPTGPVITAVTGNATCGLSNGTITAAVTGALPPVQYSIDGFAFQSSSIFTGLAPGNYTLYAKDANACYNSIPVSIVATALPKVTAFSIGASCNNNDGSVIATGTLGTAPYLFSIDGAVFQSSNTFSTKPAGFYTVTIKDATGCTTTTGDTISNTEGASISNSVTAATCGNANGIITISAVGGTAPFDYSSDGINYQPGNILTGLPAGDYSLSVRDANGCITSKLALVSSAAGPQTLTSTVVNASCNESNGSINAAASGGTGVLQYSKDGINYQASSFFNGVAGGNYTLYVRDVNLCVKTLPVTVLNLQGPSISSLSPSAATCISNDGTITASVTGGTGALQYSKDGTNFQSNNIFTGLTAGTYTITVKDTKGCSTAQSNIKVPSLSNITLSEAHTGATCGGNDGSITAAASAGISPYQYSIDGINYQPSNQFSSLASGIYSLTVKDAAGCTSTSPVTITASSSSPKKWLGLDTDWQNTGNWCGGVPVITDDVLIPTGLINYPSVTNGVAYAKNLTIEPGASVTVIAAMQIADSIKNQGTLDIVHGALELNGNQQQHIAGSMFNGHLINRLIISNTSIGGVQVSSAVGDTLKISRKLSFGFDNAVLSTGDNITLLSADSATASLGEIKENADGTPKVTINGKMVVERFYPEKRAWRLITAPLKANAAAPSINEAWQEGAGPAVTGVSNDDPHPLYGTHITGPYGAGTAYTKAVTDSGFDQSPQNVSSMKYYSHASNGYKNVANTFTTKVTDQQGFLLFVRGNRAYDISTTTNFIAPGKTILRVHGNVNAGKISIPADTGLQVIANPYPSSIIFNENMFAENAAILKNQSFWLWDPLRGSAKNTPTNVGGWVPIVYAGGGNYISTYNPSISIAGVEVAHPFDINGVIQSGAAFMIDNKATATGNFIIHETNKTDGSNNSLFRPLEPPGFTGFTTNLFRMEAGKISYWADGAIALFDRSYSNVATVYEDVRKIFSSTENLSILHNDLKIAVEKRKLPVAGDTIYYDVTRLKAGKYQFELFFTQAASWPLNAYFEDAYTKTKVPVSLTAHSLVEIDVNTDSASFAANRFKLVFEKSAAAPSPAITLNGWQQQGAIQLEWIVAHQQNAINYTIEKSADEINYELLDVQNAEEDTNGILVYHLVDLNPFYGNNYYRIKMLNQDQTVMYSPVILVTSTTDNGFIKVYPNPVRDQKLQFEVNHCVRGQYNYSLYISSGMLVEKGIFIHQGAKNKYALWPSKQMAQGIYKLVINNPSGKATVFNVAVE